MTRRDSVTVTPGRAAGAVCIPSSKSVAHRALICAALAERGQVSTLCRLPENEDIGATLDCLRALGVRITEAREGAVLTVRVEGCGGHFSDSGTPRCCRESGSTLRFMLPLCLSSASKRSLKGSKKLLSRPLDDYQALLESRGYECTEEGLSLGGGATLTSGRYALTGKSSSQFVTGLLFVLPLMEGDSIIEFPTPPESRSYIDMTIAVLTRFGVRADWQTDTRLYVPGGQTFCAVDMTVDGDASGAAFFHALNVMKKENTLCIDCPVSDDIPQGDACCPALLETLKSATPQNIPVLSLADCPDLGPVLFGAAAALGGATFTHTDRLRVKESDRVTAMTEELSKFGAVCTVTDGLDGGTVTIHPPSEGLHAPKEIVHGHNDHRIVMSLCVLSACLDSTTPVTVDDAHAVNKSFPTFFECLRGLGISVKIDE